MRILLREWDGSSRSRESVRGLEADVVQVWLAAMPAGEPALTVLGEFLSVEERKRAARFRVAAPQRAFVFARGLLRQMLGECLAVAPADLVFGFGAHGKPFLSGPLFGSDLQFNISHSEQYVAIALTRGRRVGVDIESPRRLGDWRLLAERILLPQETSQLLALPAEQQATAFLRGWTGKEAYLKATGEGLTDAMQQIQVSMLPNEPVRLLALPEGADVARWRIQALPLSADLVGTVVVERNDECLMPNDE